MGSTGILWKLCLLVCLFHIRYCNGREIYVSHTGNDTTDCGQHPAQSCKTIPYAVSISKQNDIIDLENIGGPYTVVPSSGDFINITHSLIVRSSRSRSVMNCSKGKGNMFDVFSADSSRSVVFTLQNIKIQNCIGQWENPGVIRVANASIKILDSEFTNNAMVLHHPQVEASPCKQVKVGISRSKFTTCGISRPYMSGISIMGCNVTSISIVDTSFDYSGIQFQADENITINIASTTFNGQNIRGPSLDIIMAPVLSQIALTDSTVSNHNNGQTSSVQISMEVPTASPSIHFNNVTFSGNQLAHTSGAALSMIAKFTDVPLNMNGQLSACTFSGNSAKDKGGAIYMVNVQNVKINHGIFESNSAVDGGALFILNSHHITLYNSTFSSNKAFGVKKIHYKGTGGAIRATKTDITTSLCTFSNNSALLHGQSLHATNMISVNIQNSEFLNATSTSSMMLTELYLKQTYYDSSPSAEAAVTLYNNKYDCVSTYDRHGMFHIEAEGEMVSHDNIVCCPMGQHIDYLSQPQYSEGYDPGSSTNTAWCTACPMGTYNMQRECHNLESLTWTQKDQHAKCLECPEYARCAGSGRIAALRNYWGSRKDNGTDTILFQLCPPLYCDKPQCEDIQCCSTGRAGPLCGQCQPGYNLNLATDTCIPQSDCQYFMLFNVLYAVAFGAVYFSIILLFVILTSFCLAPFPAVTSQQIQISGQTASADNPWEPGSIQASFRDGDAISERRNEGSVHSIDSGSDSFEPSLPSEYNRSVDSHGLVPVHNEETQTSDRVSKEISVKTQSNLLIGHPFVLCVVWMLVQLTEDAYQPWYNTEDSRYTVIKAMLDIIHFRPVYYLLNATCIPGDMATVLQVPLQLLCVASIFIFIIVILICGNIIMKLLTMYSRYNMTSRSPQMNAVLCQMFMTTVVLCHLPILRSCFQLIHCVHHSTSNQVIMFINGAVTCHHWWHTFVTVVIVVSLVPLGLCIWTGLPLLKARHISSLQFAVGLVFPLPASVYWVCRYCKSVCNCLFPYEFHYEVMQSGLYEMNPEHFLPVDAVRSFFTNPFIILCQAQNRTPAHLADGRHAWIIYIFLRIFVLATFSSMLSQWPVFKSIVIVTLLLIAITLHVHWQPYGRRSANRIEGYFLGFQVILAILGMNNALIYSMGIEPYGYLEKLVHVNDWIFVAMLSIILLLYVLIILHYSIKACWNKRRNRT